MTAETGLEDLHGLWRRARRLMALAAAAGAVVAVALNGWMAGLAFLLGAGGAYLSFSWLHEVVEAIGPDARPTPKRMFVLFALRYLLLAGGAYVIVKIFGMNAIAALAGVFVPVAAIICEVLYELVHGT
jgi:hypothetical protein